MRFVVPRLSDDPETPFPNPNLSDHPDGLIALGGDLSEIRLLNAYRNGIFPWFEQNGPILWWCPDPRAVLIPGHVHVPRRLQRTLKQRHYRITINQAFGQVMQGCAAARGEQHDTWITPEMFAAYQQLNQNGHAHSLEIWQDETLIGGIYGVAIGRIFFAESKFHTRRDASKIALIELMQRLERQSYLLCDCQLWNPHLEQFNIRMMDRADFIRLVQYGVEQPTGSLNDENEDET